MEHGKQMKN